MRSTRLDRSRGDSSATRMPRRIGDASESVVKVDAAGGVKVGEHLFGADFLKGEYVRLTSLMTVGEAGEFVVVFLLRRRSVRMAYRKQVWIFQVITVKSATLGSSLVAYQLP